MGTEVFKKRGQNQQSAFQRNIHFFIPINLPNEQKIYRDFSLVFRKRANAFQ